MKTGYIQKMRELLNRPYGWIIVGWGMMILVFAIGGLIISQSYPFYGEGSLDEELRLPNPRYPIQALLVETSGGATTAVVCEVFLVTTGQEPRRGQSIASFYRAMRSPTASGVKLSWESADVLLVEYLRAENIKSPSEPIEINGHRIMVKTRSGVDIDAQEKFAPPINWKHIKACGAEFYLPPDVNEERVQGIDSCVRQYRGKNMLLRLDVLPYITPNASRKDEEADKRDYHYEVTNVGGRRAEIITFYDADVPQIAEGLNYRAVLFVPQMRNDGYNLTIWAYSRSPEAREMVMQVFRSVRFRED